MQYDLDFGPMYSMEKVRLLEDIDVTHRMRVPCVKKLQTKARVTSIRAFKYLLSSKF